MLNYLEKEATQNTGLTTTVAVTHECVLDMSLLSPIVFNNILTFCHQNDDNKIQTRMRQLSNVTEQRVASWRRQSHGSAKTNNTAMNVTWRSVKINMYSVQSSKPKLVDQMHLQRTDILPSRGRLVLSIECSRTSCYQEKKRLNSCPQTDLGDDRPNN